MFRLNRLFWKVFLSLWLSGLAVMLVTVLVIGELADKDNFKSKVDFQVRLQIERFLERYESNSKFRNKAKNRKLRLKPHDRSHWPMLRGGLPLITLHNSKGKKILGGKKAPKGEKISFKVISDNNNTYQVAYYLKHSRDGLQRWQGFIFSVQALLILLTTTIASFIVSAIVVRPMNKLREHVQRLKEGEFSVRVTDKLSNRGDEIGDFAREFNQMAEYVESTLKGQQQLFQNVSHELRAPLARLLAASGIIEQQIDVKHPAIARIQLECERLTVLIDELLALAKLQQKQEVNAQFDVRPMIEQLVADSHFNAQNREIHITVADDVNCLVKGSLALTERAVSNVLGNSVKHTADTTKIDVLITNVEPQGLLIRIEDNGVGVPSEALANLCDPFYRLDTNVDGHGLGLGIAKQAMQSQHGDLKVENVEPHGLRVDITLALANSKA